MFIATLVAADRLSKVDVGDIVDQMASLCEVSGWSWLEEGSAADIHFAEDVNWAWGVIDGWSDRLDYMIQPVADRAKKLLIADMDSTMITVECIDELADYVGLKAEVSAVTERAMRGELDFAEALRSRVALLAGLSEATVAECLHERVKLMGGAVELITAFRAAGGRAVLVSGGFTHFTDSVAKQIGFDRAVANRLVVKDGALTGDVESPIVDAQTKRETLLAEAAALGIPLRATVAIGDGANDIPMIEVAGLGVAYHAKPRTEAAADARVRHGDLGVVRYALGL